MNQANIANIAKLTFNMGILHYSTQSTYYGELSLHFFQHPCQFSPYTTSQVTLLLYGTCYLMY